MSNTDQSFLKIGRYRLGKTVGTGTFGKVKIGEHVLTKQTVAVKILNRCVIKKLDIMGQVKREISILKLFKHPHIIRLYEVISTPTDIFIVMEYVSGGELFNYITKHGKLNDNESRRFFQQIISGVDYCHRNMVVHRDLKPENLLLDSNQNVKIADFGLSNIMIDGDFLKTSCGSPNYAAPEVIAGKLYAGPEIDIWSCGVILYALMCGKLPFDENNTPALYKRIQSGKFEIPKHLNRGVTSLICHMLQIDPMKRATISDIKNHEWFQKDLAGYLFPPVDNPYTTEIDIKVVHEVCENFGVKEKDVYDAVMSDEINNKLSLGYHIINYNKLIEAERLRSENLSQDILKLTKKKIIFPQTEDDIKFTKWHLGISSQSNPYSIMTKVFEAMKSQNFEWKVINPFHIIVRLKEKGNHRSQLSIQLYQVNQRVHLLDFKIWQGAEAEPIKHPDCLCQPNIMEFFEMSVSLIRKLLQE